MPHPALHATLQRLFAAACVITATAAAAQGYPAKPIRIVSPYPPGGSTDIVARLAAQKMAVSMGQPVLVDNRPGAAGAIGSEFVARSAPDGYTLLLTTSGTHTAILFTARKVPYDPLKDFTPITAPVTQSGVMLVNAAVPAINFQELLAYVKQNPGKVSYGTAGIGSSFHIMGEIIRLATRTDIVHVPYKGGAPVAQAIASGEVPLVLLSNTSGMAAVRSGKARAIAVLGERPIAELPGVPVIGELLPGVQRPADWLGFYGPGGLSAPLLVRAHAEMVKAINDPDSVPKLKAAGMEVLGNSPEEFAALIRKDIELYRKMVPIAGIKPE
ncbi:MAG: tripartite tricarboxylate transporter substrate binding protein [Burkholderiales bacterium]|nr:tripartite tricarboxylate transporter substrate binding protein [Burkholderiales bacterium]